MGLTVVVGLTLKRFVIFEACCVARGGVLPPYLPGRMYVLYNIKGLER
jgi:hypothetical protein